MAESQASISLADLPALKKAYEQAVKDKKEQFNFNSHPLLVSYAKYVIEYLEGLKTKNN